MKGCERRVLLSLIVVGLAVFSLSPPGVHAGSVTAGPPGSAQSEDAGSDQDPPVLNEQSTLSDYLTYAALNNPGLEAAFQRWKAALEKAPQVRAMPDPKFNYAYFIREVETRVGPQQQKFRLSQTFPWFGKLQLKEDVALEAANAEKERYEQRKLKLFYKVKSAYYNYYYLARTIAVTEENVDLLKQVEGVARIRYEAGTASYGDVLRSQVELSKLEDRLLTQRDLRGPLSARLTAALGRTSGDPLPWPAGIAEEGVDFSDGDLLEWALEKNPELKRIEFLAAREKAAIGLAKKNYFPDFTLGVEMIETGEALNPQMAGSGENPLVATLSVNLPIWYGKTRAAKREAEARYRAALEERSDRENTVAADLKLALYHFRDAERRINLYRDDLIPKARQALEVERRAFEAGSARYIDLIDSQRTLLEFDLAYERAVVDRAVQLAELETLIGGSIAGAAEIPDREVPGSD